MTTSNDPEAIRADIERTRAELSYNVDALTDTANPKNVANRQVGKVKDAVRGVRDSIMGSPNNPEDDGQWGDARSAVNDGAQEMGNALNRAPGKAKEATRGNPLAAGLIAFGAGVLISSLFPASRQEEKAVGELQEKLEPLKQQATDVAKEMADNLRAPAQEAAESLKSTATDAVANVKGEAQSAGDDVQAQANQAKDSVQDSTSN